MNIQSPILTTPTLNVSGNIKISKNYPIELPDVFSGTPLTVFGRYKNGGKSELTLSGFINGKKETFSLPVQFDSDNSTYDFIPRLWAARRIGYLLDYLRLNGENSELKDEVTQLSRKFGIITPYTSYLILEDERAAVNARTINSKDMTIAGIADNDMNFRNNQMVVAREEQKAMKSKEGMSSVQASKANQSMNQASNIRTETKKALKKLDYFDNSGKSVSMNEKIKNVESRAFYYTGDKWVDSKLQSNIKAETQHIRFNSEEYFAFLNANPKVSKILSLGKNIRFMYNKQVYEVTE